VNEGRIIGLVSGKGGVGKTSVCVNLGIALSRLGNEVTLIDTDLSASNLGVYMGRYDHPVKIHEVLSGNATFQEAMFRHPTGVNALVASTEVSDTDPDTSGIGEVFSQAAEISDYVLVDCAPGMTETVQDVMEGCGEVMVITSPTHTSGTNAAQAVQMAQQMRKPVLGTVVNKVEDNPDMELVDREIEMMTESHILSKIPFDQKMKESLFHKKPLVTYDELSRAAVEIKKLAAEMDGKAFEQPRFLKAKRKLRGLMNTLQS
jgi:septum site-determining protein MinD